jgi:hypothetical protein
LEASVVFDANVEEGDKVDEEEGASAAGVATGVVVGASAAGAETWAVEEDSATGAVAGAVEAVSTAGAVGADGVDAGLAAEAAWSTTGAAVATAAPSNRKRCSRAMARVGESCRCRHPLAAKGWAVADLGSTGRTVQLCIRPMTISNPWLLSTKNNIFNKYQPRSYIKDLLFNFIRTILWTLQKVV